MKNSCGYYTRYFVDKYNFDFDLFSFTSGGDISSVDGGLDPYNQHHRDQIGTFFSTLICQIEERLGNAGAGDQFFTRHKLSEALANLKVSIPQLKNIVLHSTFIYS